MARKKKIEEATKVEETTKAENKVNKYIAVKGTAMWHPFARVLIPVFPPGAMLEEDSWLASQIERGFVKKLA